MNWALLIIGGLFEVGFATSSIVILSNKTSKSGIRSVKFKTPKMLANKEVRTNGTMKLPRGLA